MIKQVWGMYRGLIGDKVYRRITGGLLYSMGAVPLKLGEEIGENVYRWRGADLTLGRVMDGGIKAVKSAPGGPEARSGLEVGIGVGALALGFMHGIATEGLWGGAKMLAMEGLVMGSVAERAHGIGSAFSVEAKMGGLALAARTAGGFLGASVGASVFGSVVPILGTSVGMALGASFGTAPVRFIKKHPIMSLGAVAAGVSMHVAKAAAYGAYDMVKAGYYNQRSKIGIDTAGDMGAFMTQSAFTQRQRAVQAIQRSHLNTRSALGHEASYLHYPQRSYHSRYRM